MCGVCLCQNVVCVCVCVSRPIVPVCKVMGRGGEGVEMLEFDGKSTLASSVYLRSLSRGALFLRTTHSMAIQTLDFKLPHFYRQTKTSATVYQSSLNSPNSGVVGDQ